MKIEKTGHSAQNTDNIRCPQDNDGFTLVEVMIAMVVLLLGMLGVMGMQYYAITGNTSSREMRTATNLGQEQIEQLKSTPYTSLSSGTETQSLDPNEIAMSGGQQFSRVWWVRGDCVALTLTGDDNTCNPGLATTCITDPDTSSVVPVSAIRVRTCWTDRNDINITHAVTLDTLRWDENDVP